MVKKDVQLANFNCTFSIEDEIYPMIDFFDKLVLPAVKEETFYRTYKNNNYFLTDVQVMNLNEKSIGEPEFALIGCHVKRVMLNIKQDYNADSGFIPIGKTEYSAPYSTFILLLRNHRLIHFKDQDGSPDIRGLATTIRSFINQYRKIATNKYMEERTLSGMKKGELKQHLRTFIYPEPEINIVPIPSPDVTESIMNHLVKISSINFRVYPLNSELDNTKFLRNVRLVADDLKAPSGQISFSGPKNIKRAGEYISESRGLADFTVIGETDNNDKVKLKPDEFVETIKASIPEGASTEEQVVKVYQITRNRPEIKEVSEENQSNYDGYLKIRLN